MPVMEPRIVAAPYRIGSSVSSVELLLDARSAAEEAMAMATRSLAASVRITGELEVTNVSPGPAEFEGALRFVVEARSGALGSLLVQPDAIVTVADLVMGGRGVQEERLPTPLELNLFTERFLEPVGIVLDAVAPRRPEPIALTLRETPASGRSMVVEFTLMHDGRPLVFVLESLAHHLADDQDEVDAERMAQICNEVPLEIAFSFTPIHLPAREVAGLSPGDVICLEHELEQPLVGSVDGKPLVKGRMGTSKRRAAIEVVDLIEGSP